MLHEQKVWDAIIVGAGPAGCAAAYDLAAAGRSVLLLDRAAFPRMKACAGGLTMKAVRALRYSIDPVVRLWVRALVLENADSAAVTLQRRAPVCAMTMREELDAYCLQKTVERGATFRRIGPLLALQYQKNQATLLCADDDQFQCRYLIGADGVHSRVRALAGESPWFRKGFALEANVPYRRGGLDVEHYPLTFDFAACGHGYGWLFPRDTHVNVGLYTAGAPGALHRDALDRYIAARCGRDRERSAPVGQFLGFGAALYLPAAHTRVLLAGDAAGFVDALTGEGIYGAIRSGQAAARAIDAALGGRDLQQIFAEGTRRLRDDLAVGDHAAARFYAEPARGFALLRLPLLPRAALRTYAEGLSLSRLLSAARMVRRMARA